MQTNAKNCTEKCHVSPQKETLCCICYNTTLVLLPCCKQPCCDSCARNWAEKTHNPPCPMCRTQFYRSLTEIPKDEKVVVTRCHGKSSIVGTIKPCKKVLKVFAVEKQYHIPYESITSYRIARAPLATACERIRPEWIEWCGRGFKGEEPQCSQLCVQPSQPSAVELTRATDDLMELYDSLAITASFDAISAFEQPLSPIFRVYSINVRWIQDSL